MVCWVDWVIRPDEVVVPSNSVRRSGVLRSLILRLFRWANRESRKELVEPESISVRMSLRFAEAMLTYRAEGLCNETAFSLTNSYGADSDEEDTLFSTGVSTGQGTSLGSPPVPRRKPVARPRSSLALAASGTGSHLRNACRNRKSCRDCCSCGAPSLLGGACRQIRGSW